MELESPLRLIEICKQAFILVEDRSWSEFQEI